MVLPLLGPTPEYVPPGQPFSNVGFVDNALLWDQLRLRFDAAYDMNRPTRGQYFIAPGPPLKKRGLPLAERRIDYQEASAYAEHVFLPNLSAFVDVPVRFLNPEFNDNHWGLSDAQIGFKLALLQWETFNATGQVRLYLPTAAVQRGLGNDEATLEPGILVNWEPIPHLYVEAEFQVWWSLSGTIYDTEILRYGLGLSYGERGEGAWVVPVLECQGWGLPRGRETVVLSARRNYVQETENEMIFNAYAGFRAGYGERGDLFVGYGRALTGEVWYKDMFRIELRYRY
jgi:hypothetical protein